jgi:predicted SAM-dependent methyltransferase
MPDINSDATPLADRRCNSLASYIEGKRPPSVKLHLGCGGVKWRDFINVDLHHYDAEVIDTSRSGCVADVFADMQDLGLQDNSVDEIFTSHTIDHFTRWQAIDMLTDWHRMLKPRGLLAIEAADFNRIVLWLFHPKREKRRLARSQFYGNQWDRIDFETHRYVWSGGELQRVLRDIGFRQVTYSHKTLTHYPGRDMRMVAIK